MIQWVITSPKSRVRTHQNKNTRERNKKGKNRKKRDRVAYINCRGLLLGQRGIEDDSTVFQNPQWDGDQTLLAY
jgi:hypothetical protein